MEVIYQGRFTEDLDMREVLEDVMALSGGPIGVLRISDPGENLNGRIVLYQHRYVVEASISDCADSGYAAVRRLLAVREGNFAYMLGDADSHDLRAASSGIDLGELLPLLPNLPESCPGIATPAEETVDSEPQMQAISAVEAMRQAVREKRSAETVHSRKLRRMKRRVRWSKIVLLLMVIAGVTALVQHFSPTMNKRATAIINSASAPEIASTSNVRKPDNSSKRTHKKKRQR